MARLVGVDLPREKRMEIALTYIYGIGKAHAKETLAGTGISPDIRVKDLGDEDLLKLRDYIDEHFRVEGDLRREVAADIRRRLAAGSKCDEDGAANAGTLARKAEGTLRRTTCHSAIAGLVSPVAV